MKIKWLADFFAWHPFPPVKTLLLVLMLPSLSSCSWVTTFVVANHDRNPLQIEYCLSASRPHHPACPDDQRVQKPRVISISQLDRIMELGTTTEYSCDPETRTIKLILKPGLAVALYRSHTYTGRSDWDEDLVSLSIKGEQGAVVYAADQLRTAFKKRKATLYILSIRDL